MPVQSVAPVPVAATPVAKPTTSRPHTVRAGETLSGIATANGTTWQALRDLNKLSNPNLIRPGDVIYLPELPAPAKADNPGIVYELLAKPVPMHISKPGGAEKWSFGNLRNYKDAITTGHFAQNTNFEVVAVAKVPVQGEVAAYCMDAVALGDFKQSGRPAYTIGFNHADLAPGFFESQPAPAPVANPIKTELYMVTRGDTLWDIAKRYLNTTDNARIKAKVDEIVALNKISNPNLIRVGDRIALSTDSATQVAPAPVAAPKVEAAVDIRLPAPVAPAPNIYKTTLSKLPQDTPYIATTTVDVKEMDARRPDRKMLEGNWVTIYGTFIKDGVLYGLPKGSHDAGYWFGIPMSILQPESEVLNPATYGKPPVQAAGLTIYEKIWDGVAQFAATVAKLIGKRG